MAEDNLKRGVGILVIGGSAGSLEVLLKVLPGLSSKLPFPIIIILHRKNTADVSLAELLGNKTKLAVKEAEEKDLLQPATIYVVPPDYHLLVEKNKTISLDYSEKVNYSRPSIDVTFQSAADIYGDRVASLLLSGANADGVEGLASIKAVGGIVAVQDPATAEVSYMPQHAVDFVSVDVVLKPDEMAGFINSLSYHL